MRIAVVGTGISGMVAAYLLHADHDLTVYEAGGYIGGHTNTVGVEDRSGVVNVDTGFIVFNDWTYPNFIKLLTKLNVATQPSSMSFSVWDEAAELEYKGDNLNTLFAQRRNLFRPGHYRMLFDIVRFYRQSRQLLSGSDNGLTLGQFLREQKYSHEFVERHLIPMGAAIWSADPTQFCEFPAAYFARFCHNHGMLNLLKRPRWRVVSGGSQRYVEKLTSPFRNRIRLSTPVESIRRYASHVALNTRQFGTEQYDHVIVATHSDQALRMLYDPSDAEESTLAAMRYQPNDVVLHTDPRCLPRRRKLWASWNYRIPETPQSSTTMTYYMNRLQSLTTEDNYFVSLNSRNLIADSSVVRSFNYEHPVYDMQSVEAQESHAKISGVNRTHYCGAYWGYGFHEDGVNSALAVCRYFGKEL